ncbi:MAG TPA: hypothetical protein VGJ20_45970 [Xanthobacteraceae bacterium]|jgi:hypothetical protein
MHPLASLAALVAATIALVALDSEAFAWPRTNGTNLVLIAIFGIMIVIALYTSGDLV